MFELIFLIFFSAQKHICLDEMNEKYRNYVANLKVFPDNTIQQHVDKFNKFIDDQLLSLVNKSNLNEKTESENLAVKSGLDSADNILETASAINVYDNFKMHITEPEDELQEQNDKVNSVDLQMPEKKSDVSDDFKMHITESEDELDEQYDEANSLDLKIPEKKSDVSNDFKIHTTESEDELDDEQNDKVNSLDLKIPQKKSVGRAKGAVKNQFGLPKLSRKLVPFSDMNMYEKKKKILTWLGISKSIILNVLDKEYTLTKLDVEHVEENSIKQSFLSEQININLIKDYINVEGYKYLQGVIRSKKRGAKYTCTICELSVEEESVECDCCCTWFHFDCVGIDKIERQKFYTSTVLWYCSECKTV